MRDEDLVTLIAVFVPFSLLSIGGGSAIIAGIQHESVAVHSWITSREFIDLFAISRAAPGPGTMLATLIGWKVAGWWGALAATMALFLPSSLLCYGVIKVSNAHKTKRWHKAMREGLAPVGVGLVIAGVISIFQLAGGGLLAAGIAAASAALLLWMPRFPTVGVLVGGAGTMLLWAQFGASV